MLVSFRHNRTALYPRLICLGVLAARLKRQEMADAQRQSNLKSLFASDENPSAPQSPSPAYTPNPISPTSPLSPSASNPLVPTSSLRRPPSLSLHPRAEVPARFSLGPEEDDDEDSQAVRMPTRESVVDVDGLSVLDSGLRTGSTFGGAGGEYERGWGVVGEGSMEEEAGSSRVALQGPK